jgi:hypothetical protein
MNSLNDRESYEEKMERIIKKVKEYWLEKKWIYIEDGNFKCGAESPA